MNQSATNFLDSRIAVRPKKEPTLREEGEFILALDPLIHDTRILNKTGKQIFKMCDGQTSVGEIIDKLHIIYKDIPKDQVRKDVYCLLRDMERMKFVSVLSKTIAKKKG